MVLEETLEFNREEDADLFISFLREKHCRAQKTSGSTFFTETLLYGSIKDVIRFYENEQVPETARGASQKTSAFFSNKPVIASLTNIRNLVRDLMNRFRPGDIIYTTEEYEKCKIESITDVSARLGDFLAENPDLSPLEAIAKMGSEKNPVMMTVLEMDGAGWVTIEPEGVRLVKTADPDELPVERRVDDPDALDMDAVKELNLTLHEHLYFSTTTRLAIDPRIHLACRAADVEHQLEDKDVDDDSMETLLHNMNHKNIVVRIITNAISDAGRCSIESLIEKVRDADVGGMDPKIEITAHFSPEYITSLVNDLRKLGEIEGNDRKLRVVR